jgi:predicted TIM-barrel fold metal-dependent hydrolase
VGYIDCDTHVIESNETWEHCDPAERDLMPMMAGDNWTVEDHFMQWPGPMMRQWRDAVFPGCDLVDVAARMRFMDEFGVDVQIMFPSWWLLYQITSPAVEAAMYRSYNRWIGERTADTGGRLRWAVLAPVRTMDRAFEELEYGREHGAVSVYFLGHSHGMSMSDPSMFPLYEKAQDLDLAISVHVGGDLRVSRRQPGQLLHSGLMLVPSAFYAILQGGLPQRFPRLRWSFIEAGSAWLPFVLQETFRSDFTGAFRSFADWRARAKQAMADAQMFVAAQMDDDLPSVIDLVGADHLVYGTDYGHLDVGSDPDGLHVVSSRVDIDPHVGRTIVDDNGRRLFGIDPRFQPAPAPTREAIPAETIALGRPAYALH